MAFWADHGADLLVLLIIGAMAAGALRILAGRKRQGRSCGCGCGGCRTASRCGKKKEEAPEEPGENGGERA